MVGWHGGFGRTYISQPAAPAAPSFDPATASVIVSGAGTPTANGEYPPFDTFNGKPRYKKTTSTNLVFWNGGAWIVDDEEDVGAPAYSSTQNVAYPWLVTVWAVEDGALPVPTVGHF